jgi:hypothetical protein
LVQAEGEVKALCVIVGTSALDGESVEPKPLYWVLLRIVLCDPKRLEFLWEQQIAKSSREGGEAIVLTCGFVTSNFLDSVTGIVAAA